MTEDDNEYTLLIEAFAELQPEIEAARRIKPMPAQPSLSQVLSDFGPMPKEALFLGVASDELPVLLNLHDPAPGPLLVVGDSGAGKTAILRSIAGGVGKMHQAENVQFGVITGQPEEWNEFEESEQNVGIFHIHHQSAEDFILSLASWAHGNKTSKQSVLLLIDDLEAVTNMDADAVQNLRWLLLRGPSRRVWPIVTLNTNNLMKMEVWLEAFRTRVLGNIQKDFHLHKLDAIESEAQDLTSGNDFVLREGTHWLKFWIPSLD